MEKIPDVVEKTLEVLANKFGTTVGYLWDVLISYYIFWAYLEFGLCLGVGLSLGLLATSLHKKLNNLYIKKKDKEHWNADDNDKCLVLSTGKFACIGTAIIVAIITITHGMLYLFNAEYYTLKDILSKI